MSDVLLRALHALFFANVVSFEKPAAPEQSFFTAVRARLPGSRLAAGGARGWGAAGSGLRLDTVHTRVFLLPWFKQTLVNNST